MKKTLTAIFSLLIAFLSIGAISMLIMHGSNNECVHEYVISEEIKPTCTNDGFTIGVQCSKCGDVLITQEFVPALGHDSVELEAVAPTCTESGLTAGTKCARCNAVLSAQEVVPVLGHDSVELEAVAPTCTESGLTAGAKCSRCDTVLSAQEVIPAIGHTRISSDIVPPTCTHSGTGVQVTCSVCGEILVKSTEISPSHDFAHYENGMCPDCGSFSDSVTYAWITGDNGKKLYFGASLSSDSQEEFIRIASTYNGDTVERIDSYAFSNNYLLCVYIPSSVKYVDMYAFAWCSEWLVIEISPDCDTSEWHPDWCMGNGDAETSFIVRIVDRGD